jgi:hypothetical protein
LTKIDWLSQHTSGKMARSSQDRDMSISDVRSYGVALVPCRGSRATTDTSAPPQARVFTHHDSDGSKTTARLQRSRLEHETRPVDSRWPKSDGARRLRPRGTRGCSASVTWTSTKRKAHSKALAARGRDACSGRSAARVDGWGARGRGHWATPLRPLGDSQTSSTRRPPRLGPKRSTSAASAR